MHERLRYLKDFLTRLIITFFGVSSIFITFAIVFVLFRESIPFFRHVNLGEFFFGREWTPLFATKKYGILPLVSGTFLITTIALGVALPIGLTLSIFLSEFAHQKIREYMKPFLEFLAAIPTVVYGYFALLFLTPLLKKIFPEIQGFNALSPGITIGIMILPYVISLSEDVMRAVPQSLREAAYALGASKLYTAITVVLPAAFSGISSAYILGISRAIGETMVVSIAAGMMPQLTFNPLDPIQTMTAYIVQVALGDVPYGTPEFATIFAVGLTLFIITLVFNTAAFLLKEKVVQKF
jgi:phosphate transport system permease protein